MAQRPVSLHPSPSMSQHSDRSRSQMSHRSQSQRSARSGGGASNRSSANGMPGTDSRGLEASHILALLEKEIVHLTGGRDRQGGPLLVFPPHRDQYFMPNDITSCLKYLSQIPSEESKRRGFTVVVDSRDGSWSNLVTLLGCLKQSLGDYLKQVLVLKSEGMGQRQSSSSSFRRDRGPNVEPQFIALNRLHTFVDRNQLNNSMGGSLMYRHSYWLQNRLDLEKFMREARAASSHLDMAESEIQFKYRSRDNEAPSSPIEALRQHRFFQDSIISVPSQVISDGVELLKRLQTYSEATIHGEESVTTLDNLESQKQVKRTLQYLENRVDKIRNYLDDKDKFLHMNVERDDVQKEFKSIVEWILGPGEKLLASQTDIGDSYETAEELRKQHEQLEIKCTDTYGRYAELRHKAEDFISERHQTSEDIRAQRDYMDTVCRSFASRLERRRTLLITSVRFHRLTEDFSRKLDDLLELLCSDITADDVASAQEALTMLQEKADGIDSSASRALSDGQSLLDEMSRPIKDAFGKDISPDYARQIKHVTQRLEELQERKMRCDELADVRKLKLQQILQLCTCERDASQAINWILELCDVMMYTHTNMGQTQQEADSLQEEHKKFETTAGGTYEYGKQLLQAALVLRRSLRYDLEPNNEMAQRLEDAWKQFSQGTNERANRLTVASMFLSQSEKLIEGLEQLMVVVAQTLTGDVVVKEALDKYGPQKQVLEENHKETGQMGRALLERLSLPIILVDGGQKRMSIDDQGAADTINNRLRKMDHKVAELNRYWSEMEQTGEPPSVQPKISRSSFPSYPQQSSKPPGQSSQHDGQRSSFPQMGQSSTFPRQNQSSSHPKRQRVIQPHRSGSRRSNQPPKLPSRSSSLNKVEAVAAKSQAPPQKRWTSESRPGFQSEGHLDQPDYSSSHNGRHIPNGNREQTIQPQEYSQYHSQPQLNQAYSGPATNAYTLSPQDMLLSTTLPSEDYQSHPQDSHFSQHSRTYLDQETLDVALPRRVDPEVIRPSSGTTSYSQPPKPEIIRPLQATTSYSQQPKSTENRSRESDIQGASVRHLVSQFEAPVVKTEIEETPEMKTVKAELVQVLQSRANFQEELEKEDRPSGDLKHKMEEVSDVT